MSHPVAAWHAVLNARNPAGLNTLLADQVVFHSPVVHTPQQGKPLTTLYLSAALLVLGNDSFRYVREVNDEHNSILEFEVQVDGITVNGVDMIRWNEQGQIVDFKVMLRPYKAIELVRQKMKAMLEQQQQPRHQ
ncbi:MAG: nuclear transport factor 2 family protein [Alcanivorax sp.]|nr:nuclear transport factor 2 family protein [Alcanivorax sp.]